MLKQNYSNLGKELRSLLNLQVTPLAITFSNEAPKDVTKFDEPIPAPTPDGRTGRVSAGCVFWMKATDKTFVTIPEDHYNCSVGSLTHGLKTLDEVKNNSDVAAILDCGWVQPEIVGKIPVIKNKYKYITYGPLEQTKIDPDVIFLRINGKQFMTLKDAFPDLKVEGKPQCHIVPMAKENNEIAVSAGCMLSRVRTGMANTEMTAAFPANKLNEVVNQLKSTCGIDNTVAVYASEDAKRFSKKK